MYTFGKSSTEKLLTCRNELQVVAHDRKQACRFFNHSWIQNARTTGLDLRTRFVKRSQYRYKYNRWNLFKQIINSNVGSVGGLGDGYPVADNSQFVFARIPTTQTAVSLPPGLS